MNAVKHAWYHCSDCQIIFTKKVWLNFVGGSVRIGVING